MQTTNIQSLPATSTVFNLPVIAPQEKVTSTTVPTEHDNPHEHGSHQLERIIRPKASTDTDTYFQRFPPLPYYADGGGISFTFEPTKHGVYCRATESITGEFIDLDDLGWG